jgi:hypothetical protein
LAHQANTMEDFFVYTAIYSAFLPVLAFFLFWSKSKSNKGFWIILIYSFYDYLTNIGLLYLSHKPLQVLLYRSYTLIEYLLFAYFLSLNIKSKGFKKIMLAASVAFCIFLVAYFLTRKVRGIDSINIGIETILILAFAFYFLFEQMNDTKNLFIYSKNTFWIILAMMLYLAGSFFIYIYASQLPTKEVARYWVFTNIFSILKNIFFTIAIVVHANNFPKKPPVNYKLYPLN